MTYRRMLYMFAFVKRNHFEVIMYVCFSHDTKHVHFGVITGSSQIDSPLIQRPADNVKNYMRKHVPKNVILKT